MISMGRRVVAFGLCVLMACGNTPQGGAAGQGAGAKGADGAGARPTGSALPASTPSAVGAPLRIPAAVPAEAVMVAIIDLPEGWTDALTMGLPIDAGALTRLRDDVATYAMKTTGLDIGKLRRAAIFVLPGTKVGMVLEDVGGTIAFKAPDSTTTARLEGTALLIGQPEAVAAAQATAQGKAQGLAAGQGPLTPLIKDRLAGTAVLLAADVSLVPGAAEAAAQFGVTHVVGTIGRGGLALLASGEAAKLTRLADLMKAQVNLAVGMVEAQRDAAMAAANTTDGPNAEAFAAIASAPMVRGLSALLEPKLEGDTLRLELAFDGAGGNAMLVVSIIGVLAAVAIPAFMKYIDKSKAARGGGAPDPLRPPTP